MHKSSLLEIIRTFTPKEIIKFEDFVNSPYFNKNKNVIKLFAEVIKYRPEFNNENLEKELVWNKLFPEKNYNYGIMKNIIHDLNKLCESFLSEEIYNAKENQKSNDFLESIIDRDLTDYFENKYAAYEKALKKNFEKKNIRSTEDYYHQQKLLTERFEAFLHNYSPQKKDRIKIIPSCEYLIYTFLIDSFKMMHKVIGHSLQYNHPLNENILYNHLKNLEENNTIEMILKYTEAKPGNDHLILKCYYSMFKALFFNDDPDKFYEFKKNISVVTNILPKSEIRDLYFTSMTCLTNLKVTLNNFSSEYFDIILLCYKSKVLLNKDGSISPHLFFSIVNMACSQNELTFAENFIEEYSPKIPFDFRDAQFNYAMSGLFFKKEEFHKSLEYLSKIQNEEKSMKYYIKNRQITIYFELNDRESFEYAFDSLKHYIRKNKLTNESRILTLTKYCEYIKAMFKLREKYNSYDLDLLKNEIEKNKVSSKKWLLRKLEEIESENKKNR
ncbi:MAG TPA: hypothetical protein PK294_01200 [Ignavibacteria bacterium]|mgnify:CR=1 FL=1|nr:hypothetical protein [Ignavibacteria bacterium]